MKSTGSKVVRIEAEALLELAERIDGPMAQDFVRAVECLDSCGGRVAVTVWARPRERFQTFVHDCRYNLTPVLFSTT